MPSLEQKLRKALIDRDNQRRKVKRAIGALRRIAQLETTTPPDEHILKLKRIALHALAKPRKRTNVKASRQIDLEQWLLEN